ncbi:MAG: MFS transporter [Chloroflexi bacterium]|nr:MFS transporter [Chloroflexota bacterium]
MTQPNRLLTVAAVYLSGLLVGISLILFPSAGPLLTDPDFHNLSSAQFGTLFTPQVITAILSSLLTAAIANRFGMKRVMQIGLGFVLLAMGLLAASQLVLSSAYGILLAATAAMGAGFGFTISALNAYAFDLFPGNEDSAVTAIHVMTGTGQVGAALLLSFFLGVGSWWGAPLTIAAAVVLMTVVQLTLPLKLSAEELPAAPSETRGGGLPLRVWLFAVVTFAYGAIEGTFGNWAPLYLADAALLSPADAALGLALFWGSVTAGRVLFAAAATRINTRPLFVVTPFAVGIVFVVLPLLTGRIPHFTALIAAGLALSFFFPYSVSLASAEFPLMTAAVSGSLVAGLQFGAGLSANVIGLASESVGLSTVFQLSAGWAVLMAVLAVYLTVTARKTDKTSESGLHTDLPCQPVPCPQTVIRREVP